MTTRRILIRRDTAANWTSANPTLASGELGGETDTGKLKLGNGSTAWNSLAYQGGVTSVNGNTGVVTGLAPISSPTFTGTPTLPTGTIATTQTAANNTTAVATTAYVDAAVSAGVATVDTLDDLSDVTAPTPTSGDLLKWNGTAWVNAAGYALLASPTFTGTVVLPATTSIGNVTNTEIGYVDGVTSAIQTQLDAKAPTSNASFTGTFSAPSGTITSTMLADGTIVNAYIDASAAIDSTKVTNWENDQVVLNNRIFN